MTAGLQRGPGVSVSDSNKERGGAKTEGFALKALLLKKG